MVILALGNACDREAAPECKARISRLERNLIRYDSAAGSLDGYGADMDLPVSDVPPQGFQPKGLTLAFYENGRTVLDGIDLVATPMERLAAVEQRISREISSGDLQLRLFIEKDLAVAPLLNALPVATKRLDLALVVIPRNAPPPPPVPSGAAEYERRRQGLDPDDWVKLLATELHRYGHPCPLLSGALSFPGVQPAEKGKHFIAKATNALKACRCHVADIDALEYVLLAALGAEAPKRRILPFSLSDAADATVVVAPGTTAQELADILQAKEGKGGGPKRFTVRVASVEG